MAAKNKVALVTGRGRGIGKAIAEGFGSLRASIVVNYSSLKAAQEIADTIKRCFGEAITVQADI